MGYLTDIADTVGKYLSSTQPEYNRQRFARERDAANRQMEADLASRLAERDPSDPAFRGGNIDLAMALQAIQPTQPAAGDAAAQQAVATLPKPYVPIPLVYKDQLPEQATPDQRDYQDLPYPSASEKLATAAATTDMVPKSRMIPLLTNPMGVQGYSKPDPLVNAISEAQRLKDANAGGVEVSGKLASSGATPEQQNEAYQLWVAGNKQLRETDRALAVKKARLAMMRDQEQQMAQKAYSQADMESYHKDMEDLAKEVVDQEKTAAVMREKADASAQKMAASTKIEQVQKARIEQARAAKTDNQKALDAYREGKLTLDRLKLLADTNNKVLDRDAGLIKATLNWFGSGGGRDETFATGNVENVMSNIAKARQANDFLSGLNQSQLAGLLSTRPEVVEAAISANVNTMGHIADNARMGLNLSGTDLSKIPEQDNPPPPPQGSSGLATSMAKAGGAPLSLESFKPQGGVWSPGFLVGGGSTSSEVHRTAGGGTEVSAPVPSTPRKKVGGSAKVLPSQAADPKSRIAAAEASGVYKKGSGKINSMGDPVAFSLKKQAYEKVP